MTELQLLFVASLLTHRTGIGEATSLLLWVTSPMDWLGLPHMAAGFQEDENESHVSLS